VWPNSKCVIIGLIHCFLYHIICNVISLFYYHIYLLNEGRKVIHISVKKINVTIKYHAQISDGINKADHGKTIYSRYDIGIPRKTV